MREVVQGLERQIVEHPTDPRYPWRIGELYFFHNAYSTALSWYRKSVRLAPQDSAYQDVADDCNLRIYEIQIDTAGHGNDPKLRELRASLCNLRIQSYERRVHDRPTDLGLRYELAKAYYASGPESLDKAIGEFQQSVNGPECKHGSHVFYFNTEKDWDPAWGGQTLVLDDGGRLTHDAHPEEADLKLVAASQAIGNHSLLFKRGQHSWHSVTELNCPEGYLPQGLYPCGQPGHAQGLATPPSR